jgi:hypothetical protein
LGSWWLSGDDRTNAAAAILGRLFPLIGDGYGLAPRITIEGGPVLALGTVQRSFGLPDNPGDGVDRLLDALNLGPSEPDDTYRPDDDIEGWFGGAPGWLRRS